MRLLLLHHSLLMAQLMTHRKGNVIGSHLAVIICLTGICGINPRHIGIRHEKRQENAFRAAVKPPEDFIGLPEVLHIGDGPLRGMTVRSHDPVLIPLHSVRQRIAFGYELLAECGQLLRLISPANETVPRGKRRAVKAHVLPLLKEKKDGRKKQKETHNQAEGTRRRPVLFPDRTEDKSADPEAHKQENSVKQEFRPGYGNEIKHPADRA